MIWEQNQTFTAVWNEIKLVFIPLESESKQISQEIISIKRL